MKTFLFEDSVVATLAPVTTGRAAFNITCGSFRLFDLVEPLGSSIAVDVRPHLAAVTAADFPECGVLDTGNDKLVLLVNARIAATVGNLRRIIEWRSKAVNEKQPFIVARSERLLIAAVPASEIPALKQNGYSIANTADSQSDDQLQTIDHLHDLVRINGIAFLENIQHRLETKDQTWHEIADGVFARDSKATLGPYVVADTSHGPILLESNFSIGPFTYLEGPLYLGPNCKIAAHSAIKEGVSTGTTCKLGGEIEATIIESYSNKQHHGFLGHAYLGSWINLGAGTCNSDLKNTYGTVNMIRGGQKVSTGMRFVGCFIGDYAKTAINTSIFTGKTIGVASMVYGISAGDVPAFTNDAQIFGKRTAVDPSVMIQTQKRMFGRRNVTQRDVDIELMKSMHELTSPDRVGLSSEPLVF